MDRIIGTLAGVGGISCTLSGSETLHADMRIPKIVQTNPFEGEYEYTPTQAEQIIEIEGLRAVSNITINPIPSNYGLITWNGSTLTVS